LPHFVAEFFLAFLIYVDLPPSAEGKARRLASLGKRFLHRGPRISAASYIFTDVTKMS